MNISWENYQVVYVSDFDYKYLPIENFENYVYLTFGSQTQHETVLEAGTKYTLHYQYDSLIDTAKSPQVFLHIDINEQTKDGKGRKLTGSGSEEFYLDQSVALGDPIIRFGLRIKNNDNTIQYGIFVIYMKGKSCKTIFDAPKLNLNNVDSNNLPQILSNMAMANKISKIQPKYCTTDSHCAYSGKCQIDAKNPRNNQCICSSTYTPPFCLLTQTEYDNQASQLETILTLITDVDSAVIVFNYIATVGTVNKKIVDKCLTVFKTHLPSLSLNEAPKILKSLVEIFVKIGSNLKKEVRKELLIQFRIGLGEVGEKLVQLSRDYDLIVNTEVYLFAVMNSQIYTPISSKRILVENEVIFKSDEASFITPSQLKVPNNYPNLSTYKCYMVINDMSQYTESEGYENLVSPITYVDFALKSNGKLVNFDDSNNAVKLNIYISNYDSSKTYKIIQYDISTDTLNMDESINMLKQNTEIGSITIEITKAGWYGIGYESQQFIRNQETEKEMEPDDTYGFMFILIAVIVLMIN